MSSEQPQATPPILDLNMEKLGQALVDALRGSHLLGHATVAGTMRDYVKPHEVSPEARLVRDMFTRKTSEVAAEWFGSEFNASVEVAYAIGAALEEGINRYAPLYARGWDGVSPEEDFTRTETTDG